MKKKIIRGGVITVLILLVGWGSFAVYTFCTSVEVRRSVLLSIYKNNGTPIIELYENDRELFNKIFGEDCHIINENEKIYSESTDKDDLKDMSSPLMDVYRQITADMNDSESEVQGVDDETGGLQ